MEITPSKIDQVARRIHQCWMNWNIEQGFTSRPAIWGEELMVQWDAMSERAKDLDRKTVKEVMEALLIDN